MNDMFNSNEGLGNRLFAIRTKQQATNILNIGICLMLEMLFYQLPFAFNQELGVALFVLVLKFFPLILAFVLLTKMSCGVDLYEGGIKHVFFWRTTRTLCWSEVEEIILKRAYESLIGGDVREYCLICRDKRNRSSVLTYHDLDAFIEQWRSILTQYPNLKYRFEVIEISGITQTLGL